jgi:hypothetical protein
VRAEPKSDEYLLCAFARASAATGDCSGADAALRVIAERKPSVRSTALFSDAVDFVLSKDRCGGKLGK